jgi:hypothetical protein
MMQWIWCNVLVSSNRRIDEILGDMYVHVHTSFTYLCMGYGHIHADCYTVFLKLRLCMSRHMVCAVCTYGMAPLTTLIWFSRSISALNRSDEAVGETCMHTLIWIILSIWQGACIHMIRDVHTCRPKVTAADIHSLHIMGAYIVSMW